MSVRVRSIEAGPVAPACRVLRRFPTSLRLLSCRSQNMSGDPEQEYFVDGVVDEIITALSRINWLFVIARNSQLHVQGTRGGREAGRP